MHHRGHPRSDFDLILSQTQRLRENFPENEHDCGTQDNGRGSGHDRVQENGQGFHGQGVGQKQGRQEKVFFFDNREDFLSIGFLNFCSVEEDDFEL